MINTNCNPLKTIYQECLSIRNNIYGWGCNWALEQEWKKKKPQIGGVARKALKWF